MSGPETARLEELDAHERAREAALWRAAWADWDRLRGRAANAASEEHDDER